MSDGLKGRPDKLFSEVSQDFIGYVQQEVRKAVRTEQERIISLLRSRGLNEYWIEVIKKELK